MPYGSTLTMQTLEQPQLAVTAFLQVTTPVAMKSSYSVLTTALQRTFWRLLKLQTAV